MRKNTKHFRPFSGFTLIEVMMAAIILTAGFIGMIQAVTINSETLDTARKQQVATQIMEDEIERLRASSWNTIAGLPATASIAIDSAGVITGDTNAYALGNYSTTTADDNTALIQIAKGFTCTYNRTYLRPSSASASTVTFLRIEYLVEWTSSTGRHYSRSGQAFFGKNGLHLSYQKS